MKKLIIILGTVLFLSACTEAQYEQCFDAGKDYGYKTGYFEGHEAGLAEAGDEGWENGYKVGYSDCQFDQEYPGQG